jgi:uncharacterized membrane protein HdeD (DUF308 family)
MVSNTQTAVRGPASHWWVVLIEGIFALILGIVLLPNPVATSIFLATVLGIYLLIRGVLALIQIFVGDSGIAWPWLLAGGILGILAGVAVLAYPLFSALVVGTALVIGVATVALFMGGVSLIQALSGAGWGVGILGALSILIGILLFVYAFVAVVVLPFILAACMIVGGIAAIFFSFSLRKASA